MSSRFAVLIHKDLQLVDVDPTSATDPVSLNGADKYSVQVNAVSGDCIAHLEGSNSISPPITDAEWTEVDDASVAEGATHIFEQPEVAYRWARVTIENDDIAPVTASNIFHVLGDAI